MRLARFVGVALVVAAGLVGMAPAAAAHASLESTSPAPDSVVSVLPRTVEMRFSEAVTAVEGGVRVLGPNGARVDDARPRSTGAGTGVAIGVDDGSSRGTYTVSWRVTSDDGHTISGSWVFHVGQRAGGAVVDAATSSTATVVSWVGRFLFFIGFLVSVGAWVFCSWTGAAVQPTLRRLIIALAGVGVVGAALVLIGRLAEATGRSVPASLGSVDQLFASSRTVKLDVARLALSTVMLCLATVRGSRWRDVAASMTAIAIAVVVAVSGHAWVTSPNGVTTVTDVVHLLAGAVWFGGLVALAVGARSNERLGLEARRFSTLAAVALGAVAISGSVSAWAQLRTPSAIWTTTYGRLLIAKVAAVLSMVLLGWFNRRQLHAAATTVARFYRTVRAEAVVGIVVLGLTATLVATVPGRDAVSRPYSGSAALGSGLVLVDVDPAKIGSNDLHLNFTDSNGVARPVDAAELQVSSPSIEPRKVKLQALTPSHFTASNVSFGAPGNWTLDITAVSAGQPASASVQVPVR